MRRIFDGFRSGGSPEFDRYVASEGAVAPPFRGLLRAGRGHAPPRSERVAVDATGPKSIAIRARPRWRNSPRTSRATSCFIKFLQWHVDRQLARSSGACARSKGMRIGLYHDLALGHRPLRRGSLGARGRFYAAGCRVGAPPDDFSPAGPGLGLSAARSRRRTAPTAINFSRNRFARTRATAERCASIT